MWPPRPGRSGRLGAHEHALAGAVAVDLDPVLAGGPLDLAQHVLDVGGEEHHTPGFDHVVAAAAQAGDAGVGAAARARRGVQRGEVPGAVAQERRGLLAQGGHHQLALDPGAHRLERGRVDDLDEEVVGPHVHPGVLAALDARAGTPQLGEPVDVEGREAQQALDPGAGELAPALRAEDPHPEAGWCAAVRRHALAHRERERRRGAQRRRAEVGHELQLQVGLAGAGRDRHRPHPFDGRLEPPARRPEAVADHQLHAVGVGDARVLEAAGEHRRPLLQVVAGVGAQRPPPGGARRRVDPHDLPVGHARPAERVRRPQLLLGGEREARELVDAVRPDARRRERDPEEVRARVRPAHRLPELVVQRDSSAR